MAPLQPLQQTVFEQGPQSAPVPTAAPAFVFQEEQVIRPEPINPVQATDPGIAWNALGAEAMGIASNLFEKTLDFLIRTKANKVQDLQDQYQSKLNDLYQQQTLELYNADKEKRLTNAQLMQNLKDGITAARDGFRKDAIEALGDDAFFQDTLDLSKWGLRYQELAVATRRAERNINDQASKLLYDSQRVANGVQQQEQKSGAWKLAGSALRGDEEALALNGKAPLPVGDNGLPVLGMVQDEVGNYVPKVVNINGVDIPMIEKREDGKYYFNRVAMEALDLQEIDILIKTDQYSFGNDSAVYSFVTGEFTKEMEGIVKSTLENTTANIGQTALVATLFAQMPDQLFVTSLKKLNLDRGQEGIASLMRLHVKNGGSKEQLAEIQGENRESVSAAMGVVNALRSGPSVFSNDPLFQEEVKDAAKAFGYILQQYGVETNPEDFEMAISGSTVQDLDNISAYAFLRDNPAMAAPLLHVIARLKSNPQLGSLKDPEILPMLLKEAINREGYTIIPNKTGIPRIVYAPQMSWFNNVNDQLTAAERTSDVFDFAGLAEFQEELKTSPDARESLTANSILMTNFWAGNSTLPNSREMAIQFARRFSPTLDLPTFEALYDGGIAEKTSDGVRMQTVIPTGELIRLAIAATPATMQRVGELAQTDLSQVDIKTKLAAAKKVFDDIPFTQQDGLIQLNYSVKPSDMTFTGSPNGGIALSVSQMTGVSGRNYLEMLTQTRSGFAMTQEGMMTPRMVDGTPLLFIPAQNRDGVEMEYINGMNNYLKLKRGQPTTNYVAYTEKDAPGITIPTPDEVISRVDRPAFIPGMETLVNMDKPLGNWQSTRDFFTINNDGLYRVLSSSPGLSQVKRLIHEVAHDPKTRIPTYDENRTLFSETNLIKLYEQAKQNGAETNGDFLGYVVRAMQVYQNNSATMLGRERTLEINSESMPEDFLGRGGTDKGVVLFNPKSEQFYVGVEQQLQQGYSLYQKGDKFYMFKKGELPTDEKERKKYRLMINAEDSEEVQTSQFTRLAQRHANAKLAREIVFTKPTTLSIEPVMAAAVEKVRQEKEAKVRAAAEIAAQKEAEYAKNPYLRDLEEKTAKANAEFDAEVKANPYGKAGVRVKQVLHAFESNAARARREYEERKKKSQQ